MTEEGGIVDRQIFGKAINEHEFIQCLHYLRKKLGYKPIALFMDQLAVHKSKYVKEYYDE